MAVLLTALPESPVFLLSKGRHEDAQKSLEFLRGANCDVSDEMAQIGDNLRHQSELGKVSLKRALAEAVYRWPMLIMMGLFLFRQLTGNMAVGYYLTDIFEEADTGLDPGLEATLVTLSQVLANLVTAGIVGRWNHASWRVYYVGAVDKQGILFPDRFGRRSLLMVSCATTSVSIASLGSYFYLNERLDTCVSAETCPTSGVKMDLLNNLRNGRHTANFSSFHFPAQKIMLKIWMHQEKKYE